MEWKKCYLDLLLVPLALLLFILYHGWLWHKVRTEPQRTVSGINSAARRMWVHSIIQNNAKKYTVAVQTMRNTIMGTIVMATTSILLSSVLAALISSTYNVKQPINDSVFGAHGESMVALKYVSLLLLLLSAFLCYALSICCVNQVGFLINIPSQASPVSEEYVCDVFERAFVLYAVGNRLFCVALPMLLWILGPVLVFFSSASLVTIMYYSDVVYGEGIKGGVKGKKMDVKGYQSP